MAKSKCICLSAPKSLSAVGAASAGSDHGLLWQAACTLERLPIKARCISEDTLPYPTLASDRRLRRAGLVGLASYCPSKYAVRGLADSLRNEVGLFHHP